MPKTIESIGYKTGRLIALFEYQESLNGKELTKEKTQHLFDFPNQILHTYFTSLKLLDSRIGIRCKNVHIENLLIPETLTESQRDDALIGYYTERASISRNNKVKLLRVMTDKTQEDFASLLGVERMTVSFWESHRRDCTTENFIKLLHLILKKEDENASSKTE